MGVVEPWTCPSCAREVATTFCGQCGERVRSPSDLTLRGFLVQIFQAFSSVDGRLLRSYRCLVMRPGELSVAFVNGQRLRYAGPFPLFFLANVLFFAVQSMVNTPVFASSLESHMHGQDWRLLAQRLVADRLERGGTTLAEYAPLFDHAVELHAKSLIVLMALPFALLLPLVFRRARPFVAHAVFSLHLYTFLLLLFSLSLVIAAADVRLGGTGLSGKGLDMFLSLGNLSVCALYLFSATGRFYGTRGARRVLQVAGLSVAVAAIVLGYRFSLFLLTLYTT